MAVDPESLPGLSSEQSFNQMPEFQAELETPEGELHLRFFVNSGNEFALPAIGIREVLEYSPDRINPMPNVSPLLLGTINIRGRVVWVGDLGQFLGDQVLANTDRSEISIIAIEDKGLILGLAIERIGVMTWLDPEKLQLPQNSPDGIGSFLKGEWVIGSDSSANNLGDSSGDRRDSEPKTLKLLDHVNIIQSARWVS
jgi:purine-binding chemotaxis protein CheW